MHFLSILKIVGALLMVLGGAQLLPMCASALLGEGDWLVFLVCALSLGAVGGVLWLWSRHAMEISIRDGFVVVTVVWITAAAAGALPYYFVGTVPTFADAMFESMSGFTTTGASVIVKYEGISHGIFLWRSLTQWLGGMGIIVLALVVLPALGIGGMQLFKREVPGPTSDKLTPRIRDTAKALWLAYTLITLAEALSLYALGMTPFEAVNHSLTTIATGGFGTRPDSISGFHSAPIEWTLIFFMFVAGMNFNLHYRLLARPGRRWGYFKDLEWVWYASAVGLISLAVVAYLMIRHGYGLGPALTKGTFQVVSIVTTTGFASDDYVQWGAFPQILLLAAMMSGGCAGSTAGGVKWVRILLVFKNIRLELLRLAHPYVVVQAKMNQVVVTKEIQRNIYTFLFLYFVTLAVMTLLVALDGHSVITALGGAASALGNVGPGLGKLGPSDTYAPLSSYVKWVLTLGMMLGRLELMTVFVAVFPFLWRR